VGENVNVVCLVQFVLARSLEG